MAARIYEECGQIAGKAGYPPGQPMRERSLATMIAPGSKLTASMLRDIEGGGRTEVDQILGDLIQRGSPEAYATDMSMLAAAYTHVKAYEVRRKRELGG